LATHVKRSPERAKIERGFGGKNNKQTKGTAGGKERSRKGQLIKITMVIDGGAVDEGGTMIGEEDTIMLRANDKQVSHKEVGGNEPTRCASRIRKW